jgi:dTDP-4-dehydrorhamnose reductase
VTLRWILTGCRGQLGHALGAQLAADPESEVVAAVDLPEVDVSEPAAVEALFDSLREPAHVVANAAAFTHVDRCEREPEAAERANAVAPGLLAVACARRGARLVHVSTDYVFSGEATRPYREEDPPDPRSVYGRTKLEGERRVLAAAPTHLVVRTSWVFGRGRNFLAAILAQARARRRGEAAGPLRVVDDQRGRPTWAVDLGAGIRRLVDRGAAGVYHVAGGGIASWWDVARLCLDEAGFADLEVERIRTQDLDLPAPRPAWSVLDCSKAEALGVRMREWREAVRAYLRSADSPLAAEAAAP